MSHQDCKIPPPPAYEDVDQASHLGSNMNDFDLLNFPPTTPSASSSSKGKMRQSPQPEPNLEREHNEQSDLLDRRRPNSHAGKYEDRLRNTKVTPEDSDLDIDSGLLHDESDLDDDDVEVHGHETGLYSPRIGSSGTGGTKEASIEQKKALWWRNVVITGMFVLSWYGFATLLSLYNKWMFSPEHYGFTYPLFVTFCHMIVQFTCASIIRVFFPQRFRPPEKPSKKDYVTKIIPTAIATGSDIGLSNFSLKIITLSLYSKPFIPYIIDELAMCKSSALIFVLGFAFLFRLEHYSMRLVLVITLISFGVFLMVYDTTDVSIPGVIMVFSASAIGGLRWALTELLMHKKAMGMSNPFATIFWLAPVMAITLAIVSLIFESWKEIFTSHFFDGMKSIGTVLVILCPGALAFSMVASEYFIIQRAGIVPLSIAGIFKEVTTITISSWVFGDQLTSLNIVGVAVTVSGIALYSWHKYQKSISSTVPLDKHGRPIETEEDASLLITNQYMIPGGNAPSALDDDLDRSANRLSNHPISSEGGIAINGNYPLQSMDERPQTGGR